MCRSVCDPNTSGGSCAIQAVTPSPTDQDRLYTKSGVAFSILYVFQSYISWEHFLGNRGYGIVFTSCGLQHQTQHGPTTSHLHNGPMEGLAERGDIRAEKDSTYWRRTSRGRSPTQAGHTSTRPVILEETQDSPGRWAGGTFKSTLYF